jgi:peptide/nickel transport system substrate-binding protein
VFGIKTQGGAGVKKWLILILVTFILGLTACGPAEQTPAPTVTPTEPPTTSTPEVPPELAYLGVNPVETSQPIYGSTLTVSVSYPRSFDGHQKVGYGPSTQLPCFNQLVLFDMTYKGISSATIIGDLAESWTTSDNGTEITFKLHQGVKWHDGVPFTADDVIYSLDKMTDPNRSVVSGNYPAYESAEKIDDYTVKVYLKYPSAGFMMVLAGPFSQIQAKHLAGTDDQSIDFLVGTGPFIVTEVKPDVDTRWKKNPDYFKKDKNGNPLPYLNALYLVDTGSAGDDIFIARRLDVRNLVVSGSSLETFDTLKSGAPEALWQKTTKTTESVAFFINTTKPPFDDIRVRRALALALNQGTSSSAIAAMSISVSPVPGCFSHRWACPRKR